MRFKISVVETQPEERIGDTINYDTAQNLLKFQNESIEVQTVGKDKFRFNNGFVPEPISRNKYIPEENKKVLLKGQADAKKRFAKEVLGNEKGEVSEFDDHFWMKPEYGSFDITNETTQMIYDTEKIKYLLLYWQIMSGSYSLIGVNEDDANAKMAPYFIQELKDADIKEAQEEMTKVDAIGKLSELKAKGDNDTLLYLSWSLGEVGFNKSTPGSTLVKSLYNFIEGKTREKNKRQTVKEFQKALAEYEADSDTFMVRVVTKIADYHSIIYTNKDKQFSTKSGDVLGKTLDEVTDFLKKPSNRDILEELNNEVMAILTNT